MNRRVQIIDVAVAIIAEMGLKGFTIRNLSQRIGVTEGAIYRHFNSKEEILECILTEFEKLSEYEPEDNQTEPMEKIRTFLIDRYQRFIDKPELARILFMENVFQSTPELAKRNYAMMKRHFNIIKAYILQAKEKGRITDKVSDKTLFRLIVGPMRLLVTQWMLTGQGFDLLASGKEQWRETALLIETRGKDE